jgi:hypothetical protein
VQLKTISYFYKKIMGSGNHTMAKQRLITKTDGNSCAKSRSSFQMVATGQNKNDAVTKIDPF